MAARAWICTVCRYVHHGEEPPDVCPLCGVTSEMFEPYEEPDPATVAAQAAPRRVVIAGAGIAGLSAAEAVRGKLPDCEIVLVSDEPILPYARINLTRHLAKEIEAGALALHPPAWYVERRFDLRLGVTVDAIDIAGHAVTLSDGCREAYDRLVLATGAHAPIPTIPGAYRRNILSLRSLADLNRLLDLVRPGCRCVVIGGGLLGLENAAGLVKRGAEVTVIESMPWLLPRQLDEPAARLLERHAAGLGIRVRTAACVEELAGDESVRGVRLKGSEFLPADVILVSAGIASNSFLARNAGLATRRGIVVDDAMRTSDARIFAAGDVAEHRETVYGLWSPAQSQGRIAGANAAGANESFAALPPATTLKVLGMPVFSAGVIGNRGTDQMIATESDGRYLRFLLREGRLVGAILAGNTQGVPAVKAAVEKHVDLATVAARNPTAQEILEHLLAKH